MAYQENDTRPEITRNEHLVGWIRYDTSFGVEDDGKNVFKAKFKSKPPRVQTEDGWVRGEPEEGFLHVTGPMAQTANGKFLDGDAFIATGDKYVFTDPDGKERIVFFTDDIGHSARHTDYVVDRTRQNERRQAWRQERAALREQEPAQEPVQETAEPVYAEAAASPTGLSPAVQGASMSGFAAVDAPLAAPPSGEADAIAAREVLMQNEHAYASAPQTGHEALGR